ncbi:GAF domain-containing protein [Nonomuraea phyllanthi]|uniref:GAF domain-containing protein n=1 Tax=Nonomuraea phyllanthi TaxID=2219224 RepID=A0A5C4WSC5_9ACTN|nr:helix-turn-helix domain-containing protein [Nonomuraea phyllanthi]KAB8196469.1 GAF domain-containing protein [Nonomuraea phyllanthi]QFY13815.1 GAF domain-containing protein [Nonomuraea phyllanthi]
MSYAHLDAYSRLLRGAHEAAATGRAWPQPPRRLITASWQRSLEAGIDPESKSAPLVYDASLIGDMRRAHPLRPLLPLINQTLSSLADEVMIVTDGDGRVLWRRGDHAVMRRADHIGLSDGHQWAERSVGTNGIGTALADRRPVHVYSEEHLLRVLHIWSCSAAPITDPDSGAIIGCVDVSGTSRNLHPATVALVAATAKLAETQLALRMHERDERLRRRYESLRGRPGILLSATGRVLSGDPAGDLGERLRFTGRRVILADGSVAPLEPFAGGFLLLPTPSTTPATLALTFLGDGPPRATFGELDRPLSLRHAEILALLALHPHGLTAEQLSFHVYGDEGNPVTIRAEIHRLRAQLGDAIAAKPYRLTCPVEADFLEVRRHLSANDPRALARAYTGPLLLRSESPELRRERDELEAQVRACLLRHGSPDELWAYAQTCNGRDDYEVLERLADLPPTDPRSAAARSRLCA